ncbi:hypothetical protein ABB37_03658 [Leptomonas pyrrhocoris]|uniref:Uncharacterized protein n=1 Tax=Leptomonas pyrrhocoris TaxID=157538 RepID=A0A0M9G2S3_LEPPY|nr:hypothetical protein ABB37_03658 [Leptomonas pyrrhocoris]KPA81240.1 hypothetical protein ABB37_03658 [Leptomonas pyrrhocoris]|eukprot:XP_015659679.1 hypothetical protein ABB37_03658 [Leptomonas pyrrhocoris]
MSGVNTSSRHHSRPSSARRNGHEGDYSRNGGSDLATRSSPHRHLSSSSRNSPRKHRDAAQTGQHRFRSEGYTLEDGVPPLHRQSTQPPRRTSSTPRPLVSQREAEASLYHRRAVEPVSSQRSTTPHVHRSPRRASPAGPAHSTALVLAEEQQVSPRRHSARHSAQVSPRRSGRDSPRRSHHDSRVVAEDGGVRSPRRHISPKRTSPRRAHRQTGSPIRPERRAESSRPRHRHASAEPRTRSPHGSARRHRESQSARPAPAPVPEATHRQDTLRYRSPPLVEESKRRTSSRHDRHRSHTTENEPDRRHRPSSRRHDSAHRSRSNCPPSRHDSEHRHGRERRSYTPVSANIEDESRHARHASRHRQKSPDLSVAPQELPRVHSLTEAVKGPAPAVGGSTFMRPNTSSHMSTRRSSGSCIEVISVNSVKRDSLNSWMQSPRRSREMNLPVVAPDPNSEKIMQCIDSTRHWINSMKTEVEKNRTRALQLKEAAEAEAEAEEEAARQREMERPRRDHHRAAEKDGSAHRHRSSSRGSQRRTRSSHEATNGVAGAPVLIEPEKAVDSRRRPRAPIAPAAPPKSNLRSVTEARRSGTHSTREPSASMHTAPSDKVGSSSSRPTKSAPALAPAPALAVVLHDTLNSSRQDGFDYPIFSFVSFLDGNTFDSTVGLCQYNTELAESLSDEHLEILREVIFANDEEAFAELLYGDDVQAELDVIANTLGHSEDITVQREIVILQRAAVRRFNEKCSAALRTLLAARGGLADAVQIAASQLERRVYEAGAAEDNSP